MCPPGAIDIGTCCTICCDVWVEAISVTYTGKHTTITPSTSTRCVTSVNTGRRSTITSAQPHKISPPLQGEGEGVGMGFLRRAHSVLHLLLNVTELQNRQRDHDHHQHHRLRRRAAEVERFEPVVIDLVDENGSFLAWPAVGGRIDDRKRLEERVDDVDHQQEKRRRRKQRE